MSLKNARDAVKEADVENRMITVQIEVSDTIAQIRIIDNGIGIERENLEKIFAYGYTTKEKGHGYGLHGCANNAMEMGGSLTVSSEGAGAGATFNLVLPIEAKEENSV